MDAFPYRDVWRLLMTGEQKRQRRSRGLLVKWIVSYASMILVAFLFILCGYFLLSQDFRKETVRVHRANVKHSQVTMDYLLSEILTITGEIVLLPEIRSLGGFEGKLGPRQYYLKNQLRDELSKLHRSHPAIETVFVYFRPAQYVVSSMGAYEIDYYFDTRYGQSGLDQAEWTALLFQEDAYVKAHTLIQTGAGEVSSSHMQFVTTELDLNEKGRERVSICLTVKEETMKGLIGGPNAHGIFFILDEVDRVFLADPSRLPDNLPRYVDLEGTPEAERIIDGQILTCFPSLHSGLLYVSLSYRAAVESRLNDLRWILVGLLLCFWIVGAAAAYGLARRNYRPVTRLIETISCTTGPAPGDTYRGDEYGYIEESFDRLNRERASIQDQLKLQQESLRAQFLSRLLLGSLHRERRPLEKLCQYHGLTLERQAFVTVILRMEHDHPARRTYLPRSDLESAVADLGLGWVCEINGLTVLLLKRKTPADDRRRNLHAVLRDLQARLQMRTGLKFTIAASRYTCDLAQAPVSYDEAHEALDHRMIYGAGSVISYYDVAERRQGRDSFDSLGLERRFINLFCAEKYREAEELLQSVFDSLLSLTNLRKVRIRLFGFINLLLDAVGSYFGASLLKRSNAEARLLACTTIDDVRTETHRLFKEISEYAHGKPTVRLMDKVLAIIEEDYANAELSVGYIADKLGLSISNFSCLYKEETGIGPLDSIHRVRLSKAKSFLQNTRWTVKEIAASCGYLSDITFIRVFKKYEGITPGRYRSQTITLKAGLA